MKKFRSILSLLSRNERYKVFIFFVAMFSTSIVDMLSIASVLPFMAVVTNPGVVETNAYLQWLFQSLNFNSTDQFLIFLGFVMLSLIVGANGLRFASLWYNSRFIHSCKANLSVKMLHFYMRQPYPFFLSRNTSNMGKNILEEVARVIQGVLQPMLMIVARGLITLLIFALLVIVDPLLALLIVSILGGSYTLIFISVRRGLGSLGARRAKSNEGRFKTASEALCGIKDLKILGREKTFLDKFTRHTRELAYAERSHSLITQAPKFALETLSFGGIVLIVIYFLSSTSAPEEIIPVLALYAFAGYRLMPSLQALFQNISTLRFNAPALDMLLEDMKEKSANIEILQDVKTERLPLHKHLVLDNITFSYPQAEEPVLHELSLCIKSNSSVGFVGATGSGKTTTIDVILGLLSPHSGQLRIDGKVLDSEFMARWQRNIGYVPQFIFLSDDTVASNIAFGIPEAEVDQHAVEQAARIANLHEFVTNELPRGYQTQVGERGVRLSGGQRQRIGIARALYHDPQVLILDEATSSLDNLTEEQVMRDVQNLAHKKTILMIAHRLSTVRDCDMIFMLDKGKLIASGSYSDLMAKSEHFRLMSRRVEQGVEATDNLHEIENSRDRNKHHHSYI